MKLPRVTYADRITKGTQIRFGGLEHTLSAGDGEIWDMENLTGDFSPVLSPRQGRWKLGKLEKPGGLFAMKKLCWVDGETFYYGGAPKGAVSEGTKQFRDSQNYIRESAETLNRMGWKEATDPGRLSTRAKVSENLRTRSAQVRSFLEENRGNIAPERYDMLHSYLDDFDSDAASISRSFDEGKAYYGQWKTEDDYNAYQNAQKEYERKVNLDIGSADQEIRDLEKLYEEMSGFIKNDLQGMTFNPDAYDPEEVAAAKERYGQFSEQYGDLSKLEKLINEKKRYKKQAEYIQKGVALAGAAQNEDFKNYSGYISTKSDSWLDRLVSEYGLGYQDLTYEYINNQNGIRDEIESKWAAYNTDSVTMGNQSEYADKGYDLLTEDEVAVYNYYYAKEGKDKAQEYLDSIQETLNQRKASSIYAGMEGKTGLELIYGAEAGLDQFKTGMQNLFNGKDAYIAPSYAQMASAMVREDLADNGPKLPEWLGGASLGQAGYDAITTAANMAPSMLASVAANMIVPGSGAVVGTGLIGASAAGNAYQEALNEGYDKKSARAYSTLVGASEAGLQYLLGGISNENGNIVYNIGRIEERSSPTIYGSSAESGALGGKTSFTESLPQDGTTVKQYSISSAAVDKKSVAGDLRAILNRGGNVAELRQYIDQLERGGSTKQTGRNSERNGAQRIIQAAKRNGISVEEYLRQNWEQYDVDGQWNEDARAALEMERRKGGRQYSVGESSSAEEQTREDNRTAEEIREELPAKARDRLAGTERKLLSTIQNKLGVTRFTDRPGLQNVIREISDEYLRTGTVADEKMGFLFDKAYAEGIVADSEFYDQYKDIKKHLAKTTVTLSQRDKADIADFDDFRRRAFGTLRIANEGGLPVDTAYGELHSMAPELFPERITHPADQLQRMYEVGRSIQVSEKTLNEYHSREAAVFRKWAKNEFDNAVADVMADLKSVKRFADEKAAAEDTPKITTPEEAKDAYEQLKKARKTYEKAMAKSLLTAQDEMQVGRLLRGEILPEHLDPERDNVKDILAVYEAKREYEDITKQLGAYKREIRGKLREEADSYLETANDWKDKRMGLAYSRETMRRNVQDIVPDEELAKQINDTYFEPVHISEAEATRFKTAYRNQVRELKLSTKVQKGNLVSEAHAVQLLGEAEDNIRVLQNTRGRMKVRDGKTLSEWQAVVEELWKQSPGLDEGKIRNAVSKFREIYDDLFQKMNEVRIRNGYEPVNYRQGYFPHFQPGDGDGILAHFGKVMGIDTQVAALPTTINGLTHTFKPGIQWFGNAQERLGFNTAYDAVEGFDKYIEGVASVIYQTDNIQRLRALATQIRYRTSDEGIKKQVDAVNADARLTDEEKQLKLAYVIPPFGGNQVQKIWKGVSAYIEGGSYNVDKEGKDILQYPVFNDEPQDFWSLVRASILGKSSLPEAQDWVDSGFKSLSAKQTAVYQDMAEAGVEQREAYDLIRMIQSADGADAKRGALDHSGIAEEGKAIAFYGLVATESERELMDLLTDAGAGEGAAYRAVMAMKEVDGLKGGAKKDAERRALAKSGLTEEEKMILVGDILGTEMTTDSGKPTAYANFLTARSTGLSVDEFMELRSAGADMEDYLVFTGAGIGADDAKALALELCRLKPETGEEKVSSQQRCRVIVDSDLTEHQQIAALSTVMPKSELAKVETGCTFDLTPKAYVGLKDILPKYDANGNGSYTQAEVEDAIDALSKGNGNVLLALIGEKDTGLHLTRRQMAALWQMQNKEWKPWKNPFDREVGQQVYDAMHSEE